MVIGGSGGGGGRWWSMVVGGGRGGRGGRGKIGPNNSSTEIAYALNFPSRCILNAVY